METAAGAGGETSKAGSRPSAAAVGEKVSLETIAARVREDPLRFAQPWKEGERAPFTVTAPPPGPDGGKEPRPGPELALFGPEGSIQAPAGAPNAVVWIYRSDTKELHAPPRGGVSLSLSEGYLPVPKARWGAGEGIEVQTELTGLEKNPGERDTLFLYRVMIFNSSGRRVDASVCLVLRPLGFDGVFRPLPPFAVKGASILAPGRLAVSSPVPPRGQGEISIDSAKEGRRDLFLFDVSLPAVEGDFAQAVPSRTLDFLFSGFEAGEPPPRRLDDTNLRKRYAKTHIAWKSRDLLDAVRFTLPDRSMQNEWRAALARLIVAARPEGVGAAPVTGEGFRCLETAQAAAALNRAGRFGEARTLLESFAPVIGPGGGIPASVTGGAAAAPATAETNGRALFSLVDHYRFTGDGGWLEAKEPLVTEAAGFLADLVEKGPAGGLLPPPPGASEEGKEAREAAPFAAAFWALAGLDEAAFAEGELGRREEKERFSRDAAALRKALRDAVPRAMKRANTRFIPEGPGARPSPGLSGEDPRPSPEAALAMGACAWPGNLFTYRDRWAARAFEVEYDLWFARSGGGMETERGFLSAGMEFGSPLLALRKRAYPQRILDFHAHHVTLPGLHTWARYLAPAGTGGKRGKGGPIADEAPSLRADAAFVTLMRNIFVMELDGYLFLIPGVTLEWFAETDEIGVEGAPTRYGKLSFRIKTEGQNSTSIDFLDTTAVPPRGYMMNQIVPTDSPRIRVDGKPYTHKAGEYLLVLPAAARRIEIDW